MKTVDERETPRATTAKKKQREKRAWGNKNYYGMVRAKWFSFALKLGFFQLIWKAFLNYKSTLEVALSIILKQRELYESKHVAVECRG